MPEQKLAQTESNAEKLQHEGADVGHTASENAAHKMSNEASDLMRNSKTSDSKSSPKDEGCPLKDLLWDMFIIGL
jgi:hypothetical protein